jgi:hypothetical protein
MQGTRPRAMPAYRRGGGIAWLNLVSAVLVAAGITIAFIGHDTLRWAPPPVPPAWAAGHPADPRVYRFRADVRVLPPSEPVRLDIPAIGVRARVTELGLNPDGSIAVPPLATPFVTGWYDGGTAPGSPGAAVILGHVDAAGVGPAVFYYLGNMRPGDKIYVGMHNGRTAVFETYSVAEYLKTRFPTSKVYGYTSWPTLRLVTCGGDFDAQTGHYLGNTVVFASYVGPAGK